MEGSRAATWVESCGQMGSFGMKLGMLLDDLPLFGTGFVGFRSKLNSAGHCHLFSSLIVCALFVCTIFFFYRVCLLCCVIVFDLDKIRFNL